MGGAKEFPEIEAKFRPVFRALGAIILASYVAFVGVFVYYIAMIMP